MCKEPGCECTGANWRKSSTSNPSGNSIEFGGCNVAGCGMVHLRDTKNPKVTLDYARTTWCGGLAVIFQPVKREDIPAGYNTAGLISPNWWMIDHGGIKAYFTEDERLEFVRGATRGEFAGGSRPA